MATCAPEHSPVSAGRTGISGQSFFRGLWAEAPGPCGDYDYYVDCTGFHDPQRDRKLQSHIGTHDEMVKRVAEHQDFDWHLRALANFFNKSQEDELRIGVFCKAGRHRSVAMAFLLSKALAQLHCEVKVAYLEQENNWTGLCTDCSFCKDTARKDDCVQRVVEKLLGHLKGEWPE